MAYRIALIPGDGIGREVVPAARQVLDALGLPCDFVELAAETYWVPSFAGTAALAQ